MVTQGTAHVGGEFKNERGLLEVLVSPWAARIALVVLVAGLYLFSHPLSSLLGQQGNPLRDFFGLLFR